MSWIWKRVGSNREDEPLVEDAATTDRVMELVDTGTHNN